MPRVIVTGASGFIGSHLVQALAARGWETTALVRPTSKVDGLFGDDVRLIRADMMDVRQMSPALEGHDVVFHLAGNIVALRPDNSNVFMPAVRPAWHKRVWRCHNRRRWFTSQVSRRAGPWRGMERRESDLEKPVSAYGKSKLAAERALQPYADRLPTTIVRPGIVFGPRDRGVLSLISGIKYSGCHVYPRWRTPILSLIYVNDLLELLIAAAERGERLPPPDEGEHSTRGQGVYFAGCDEHPTYHQLGWLAAQALGRRWFIPIPLTPPLPFIVGGVSEVFSKITGKPSYVNLDKIREAVVPSWQVSNAKVRERLGFQPAGTLLNQLTATVAWYRQAGWL